MRGGNQRLLIISSPLNALPFTAGIITGLGGNTAGLRYSEEGLQPYRVLYPNRVLPFSMLTLSVPMAGSRYTYTKEGLQPYRVLVPQ